MTKQQALDLIDSHKNALINPVEMLNWTWLRLIILSIPEQQFDDYANSAAKIAAR